MKISVSEQNNFLPWSPFINTFWAVDAQKAPSFEDLFRSRENVFFYVLRPELLFDVAFLFLFDGAPVRKNYCNDCGNIAQNLMSTCGQHVFRV